MKLFDQIKHFFNIEPKKENENKELEQAKVQIEKNEEPIIIDIYKDYPEMPYIHPDRDIEAWLNAAKTNNSLIVPKENMIRDEIGLLPGDIYLLFWLFRHRNQNFPSYFESFFGININTSIQDLLSRQLISNDLRPTKAGCEQIDDYAIYLEQMKHYIQKKYPTEIY